MYDKKYGIKIIEEYTLRERFLAMVKRVTIKDVAEKAGVSHATVSRALNNHEEINIETRNRIKQIAKELNYFPNSLARGLVKNTSNSIGVVLPDISNPFFPKIIRGVEDFAHYSGRSVIITNTSYDEQKEVKCVKEMVERRVEGLVVIPASVNSMYNIKSINIGVPIVYVCAKAEETNDDYVVIDDQQMGCTATEYLLDLGHKDILFVGGSKKIPGIVERIKGFAEALQNFGISYSRDKVIDCSIRKESGYEATLNLIKNGKLPTAIVAGNDFVALGIMEALEENGYSVPGDISIIGFDNIDFAGFSQIGLTTMDQPKYEMGRKAAEILLQISRETTNHVAGKVMVESSIKIRKTCKNINL